mgnify:CR=1 FL=1
MKELVLKYEWKEWTDKNSGEVRKFRVFYVEWGGLKIPVKAGDNTANQILNQIFDNMNK